MPSKLKIWRCPYCLAEADPNYIMVCLECSREGCQECMLGPDGIICKECQNKLETNEK